MIFIAGINQNNPPRGGQEGKNQVLLRYLQTHISPLFVIDTYGWKRKLPYILYQIIKNCRKTIGEKIFLSISNDSAYKVLQLLNVFNVLDRNEVHLFIVGGEFHNWIMGKNLKLYQKLYAIYPESSKMTQLIREIGLNNAKQIPNFRINPQINKKVLPRHPICFIFFSRIIESKGCQLILDAMKLLNEKLKMLSYYVDFYGPTDNIYHPNFEKQIQEIPNARYKGFLNLTEKSGYQLLADYHLMLFPSFYEGEGYPGVIIDALMAEVPVIASDWHFNTELITTQYNGLIVDNKSVVDLAEAMETCIKNPELIKKLTQGASSSKKNYDIYHLLKDII